MRLFLCALALTALAGPAALAQAPTEARWTRYPDAHELHLRDVVAIVRIVPEARTDIAVSVRNPGPLPDPEMRVSGSRLVIDGELGRRAVRECNARRDGGLEVEVSRYGRLRTAQILQIDVRMPRDAVMAVGGAVQLHVGPTHSLRARVAGCGAAEIDEVAGDVDLSVSGAPDVRLHRAEHAEIVIAGAGDVIVGEISDGLSVSIAGAGDLVAERVDGPTSVALQGAGDVNIRDGRAEPLSVVIAGAGDVIHSGVASRFDATIVGAGDVRVRRVEGEVSRRVIGVGEVVVSQR